jgi:hypothetical protein
MRKIIIFITLYLLATLSYAQTLEMGIDAADAAALTDGTAVTIKDYVKEVKEEVNDYGQKIIYVNFGDKYPNNSFALLINQGYEYLFPNLYALTDKFIEAEGIKTTYHWAERTKSAPCIIISSEKQIRF